MEHCFRGAFDWACYGREVGSAHFEILLSVEKTERSVSLQQAAGCEAVIFLPVNSVVINTASQKTSDPRNGKKPFRAHVDAIPFYTGE